MQEYIVRQHSVSSFAANWLCNKLSLSHVCFASSAINGDHQRRRRDLNPRAAINDLLPFQGSPFSLLGTSPQKLTYDSIYKVRGEGISSGEGGIRTHAPLRTNGFQDRLVMTTSIPLQTCFSILQKLCKFVKYFFKIFPGRFDLFLYRCLQRQLVYTIISFDICQQFFQTFFSLQTRSIDTPLSPFSSRKPPQCTDPPAL